MRSAWTAPVIFVLLGASGCGATPEVATTPKASPSGQPKTEVTPVASATPTDVPVVPAGAGGFANLSVGEREGCFVSGGGELFCWGSRGNTADAPRDAPVKVAGITEVAQVAVGGATLVRRKNGTVLTLAAGKPPKEAAEPKDAVDVAAGINVRCALSATGAVFCAAPWSDLARVAGISDAVDVAAGEHHACAIRKGGSVACWGSNGYGQLGDPKGARQEDDIPQDKEDSVVQVKGVNDAVAIGAGREHTCVLRASGKVACWGSDYGGNLGDGAPPDEDKDRKPSGTVVDVVGITDAIGLSDGGQCALRKGGVASCWGSNDYGVIGDGTTNQGDSPAQVKNLPKATAIQSTGQMACAVAETGALYCWGNLVKSLPTPVPGLADAKTVAAGWDASCAVRAGGALVCWGASDSLTGNMIHREDSLAPEDRYKITDAVAVAMPKPASRIHDACAVRASGEVVCWSEKEPFRPGVSDAKDVAVGQSIACALLKDGGVSCWGTLSANATTAARVGVKVAVKDATVLAAGGGAACAVRKNGEVVCWGNNEWGLLGNGKKGGFGAPAAVSGLSDAVSVTMGFVDACALRRNGEVLCWGSNLQRIADSKDLDLLVPTKTRVHDATAVAAGGDGVCAIRKSGAVSCWGVSDGVRGAAAPIESSGDSSDIPNLTDAVALSIGQGHACAIRKGGQVVCWGVNEKGQLGNGTGPRVPSLFAKP